MSTRFERRFAALMRNGKDQSHSSRAEGLAVVARPLAGSVPGGQARKSKHQLGSPPGRSAGAETGRHLTLHFCESRPPATPLAVEQHEAERAGGE